MKHFCSLLFLSYLQNNQVVGIGSGSTIVYAVDRLGKLSLGETQNIQVDTFSVDTLLLLMTDCEIHFSYYINTDACVPLCVSLAERVRQEKLKIVCVPTSFQVSVISDGHAKPYL